MAQERAATAACCVVGAAEAVSVCMSAMGTLMHEALSEFSDRSRPQVVSVGMWLFPVR